jgi:hypothetical protein
VYFLCFVDDGGERPHQTFAGLLVPIGVHVDLYATWMAGRRKLEERWDVPLDKEIKANLLMSGRGHYSLADSTNPLVSMADRFAAYEIMLGTLTSFEDERFQTTVTCQHYDTRNGGNITELAFASFVRHVADWAATTDNLVLLVYDADPSPREIEHLDAIQLMKGWGDYNNSYRLREVYAQLRAGLPQARGKPVIKDMLLQSSIESPLIQAADFLSFAALQYARKRRGPQNGSRSKTPERYRRALAEYYLSALSPRGFPDDDHGIHWVGYPEQKAPRLT